jgi:peptidoglycan/xylan/chitin deacetylase (PgdA/CDA1 family)
MLTILSSVAAAATSGSAPSAAGVPVLIYHQIVTDDRAPGETIIHLARFTEQMRYLAEHGYTPIDIDTLVRYMRDGGALPHRPVVLTFDDGWRSTLNAVPVLQRYGFKASFWIIAGAGIGGDYLDWRDVEDLARQPRFEVNSHTMTHPWDAKDNLVTWTEGKVTGKGDAQALEELTQSKRLLEERLNRPQRYLAWPCGWYNDRLIELAQKAGYEALFTAEDGLNMARGDRLRIKRTFIDGSCGLDEFVRSLRDGQYRICQASGQTTLGHRPPEAGR